MKNMTCGEVQELGTAAEDPDIAIGPIAVTRHQAAQMVALSVTEIDDERRAGRLLARKHGRKVLIPVAELKRWANSLPADEMRFAPEVKRRNAVGGVA